MTKRKNRSCKNPSAEERKSRVAGAMTSQRCANTNRSATYGDDWPRIGGGRRGNEKAGKRYKEGGCYRDLHGNVVLLSCRDTKKGDGEEASERVEGKIFQNVMIYLVRVALTSRKSEIQTKL